MESGVVTFNIYTFKTAEIFEGFEKWGKGSLAPMLMSTGYFLGVERGIPIENEAISRGRLAINHYKDLESFLIHTTTPEYDAYIKDIYTTWGGKFETSWQSVYLVVRRLKGFQSLQIDKGNIVDKNTFLKEFTKDDGPVALIRGISLTSDDWEKYDAWVKEWGYKIYIPLLLKIPGLIEYCRCWLSNIKRDPLPKPSTATNPNHPQDLSIFYFENMRSYQNYLKSKELEAYNQNLAAAFPSGLNYMWDTAFRLMNRFSK